MPHSHRVWKEGTRKSPFFVLKFMQEVKEKIGEWLKPALQDETVFLVEVKVLLNGKKIEVYLDSDAGIGIDQCAVISRQLEKNLDESGLVPENYVLEVSSPGITNPLKVPRQYKKRIGSKLEVWTVDGNLVEGELKAATNEGIELEKTIKPVKKKKNEPLLEVKPEKINIEYKNIKKALLQLNW